jgi:hypothetical protein
MIDARLVQLFHDHGGGRMDAMRPVHDAAQTDPERAWTRGRTIYRCDCGDQVILGEQDEEAIRKEELAHGH